MPRTNPPRVIGSEADLRRRIAYEREARGWSPAGLASRLTHAGCPIQQSAIWKIENANRRITVDELVTLARVFELPMDELLVPPEVAADKRARELIQAFTDARGTAEEAWFELAKHTVENPDVAPLVEELWSVEDRKFAARVSIDKMRSKLKGHDDGEH